jgi:hypothetical protein
VRGDLWKSNELRKLRRFYPLMTARQTAAQIGRTPCAVKTMARKLGLRRPRRPWTEQEIRILCSQYPSFPTVDLARKFGRPLTHVYQKAKHLGLAKTQAYLASPAACRLRRGDHVGRATQFKPGQRSWNKGVKHEPGWGPGRMKETQFKPGNRTGAAQAKWKPVGTIRLAAGYLRMKVKDDPEAIAGKGGQSTNWMFVHRMVWEQAHGPIPADHRIWWKDGNHLNCELTNLELLSDREHIARTTIHNLPEDVRQVIHLTGAIKRAMTRRRKLEGSDTNHGQEPIIRSARPSV